MPYKLRKAPRRDAYWVINTETGKKHSNDPLPKDRAEAQMRALYASEGQTGGGQGIPISLLQILARASYSGRTPLKVGGFELVRSSPTIKIYKRGDGIVVSVRGTNPIDTNDLVADFASVKGSVSETTRYKKDETFLREFQQQYPKSEYRYTAVGHSLGGAIIDEFLREGLVQNAFSFNPMIQPQDRGGSKVHRRLYNNEDPLYLMFGKGVPNVEVRDPKDPLWLAWAKFKLPRGLRELFVAYDAHRLQKFRGGLRREDTIVEMFPTKEKVDEEVPETRDEEALVDVPKAEQKRRKVHKNAIAFNPKWTPETPAHLGISKYIYNEDGPERDPKTGRKAEVNILFPLKKVETRPVPTGRMVKTGNKIEVDATAKQRKRLEDLEDDLRTLSHFYLYRDPAASLGFRVVADDIHSHLVPTYKARARPAGLEARMKANHDKAQKDTVKAVLGESPYGVKYDLPDPTERVADEVAPFLPLTTTTETDPANPMYGAPPQTYENARGEVKVRYNIPPTSKQQKEFLLQDYPNVKGTTMYLAKNLARKIPSDARYIKP